VLADTPMAEFIADTSGERVDVTTPDAARLASLVAGPGVEVVSSDAGALDITGVPASTIGEIAAVHGLVLHQLTTRRLSLEEAFMQLTNDSVDYHGTNGRDPR
jgi:ABC-2 type transport system ATP-binding protein